MFNRVIQYRQLGLLYTHTRKISDFAYKFFPLFTFANWREMRNFKIVALKQMWRLTNHGK